ncbi:retrovirus-related Pol polyprotein from transposon opus [Nephila pilipes]|uniref:Retrovirus-related Pol polyprotein from transposon opus n=1 Tax=Nephila pilipes TaxID=299642 RepID=A0A8X6P4C5_NEPPI|nr:retrovirus-related Pol polyprotein from transposon opus [Nephila pilipes]
MICLSLFKRQAKIANVDVKYWISCILTLLTSEIVQLISRASKEKFSDNECIKTILLKRFKVNPESFRKKFVLHQEMAENSWMDICYEITNYFVEWIGGLVITDFEGLKNLIITAQLKN